MESPKFLGTVKDKFLVPFRLIPEGGIPPDKMAFSITLGMVTGVFPVLGATTAISLLLTMLFRQNVLVVQSVQWVMALFQILLIIPFMQIGAHLLQAGTLQVNMHEINQAFGQGIFSGLRIVGILHLYAILTWTIIAVPFSLVSYVSLRAVFNIKRNR